ncbi:MAG: hypothetical protein ABIQ64_00255 [Candidatus Saccharimonadales bacterium]
MNQQPTNIVIFSHGFGVHKTNRGLFTAIANALPHSQPVLFDYSPIHEESKTITARPLHDQVLKLRKVINTARLDYPNAVIDLVCHEQGCVVAALLKPRDIRKIIMLAPPAAISEDVVIKQLASRSETPIDPATRTRLSGSDGSTTVIHPEYWQGLSGIKPIKLYNNLARFTQLRIINAKQDDVIRPQDFEGLDPSVSCVSLTGNHYFEDEASRNQLLHILQKELAL